MTRCFALAALATGCSRAAEPELLVPDAVAVEWSEAYNAAGDGLGAVVPVDVMVYDGASGAPLPGVVLHLTTEHDGTWILLPDAVSDASETSDERWFDVRHDRFVAFTTPEVERVAGSATLVSGPDGVARATVFVDRFPRGADWVFGGGARSGALAGGARGFQDVALEVTAASGRADGAAPEPVLEAVILLQAR